MRTPSRLVAVLAAAAALAAVPSAASAVPADPSAAVEPTSRGEAVVGFTALPVGLATGSTLRGYAVLRTDAGGAFAVVAASDVARVRRDLAGLPGLRYVEDNVTKVSLATPNDPSYSSAQYGPQMMGAPLAWDRGYGSSSVVVSVIDTGIRRTHQDFQAARILGGYDYVNRDSNPADDCDHGSHVSGTIAATTNNATGVAGMSQATILPYKVLAPDLLGRCSGSADNIASAIRAAADNGAKIISMSIGGPDSQVERDAVVYAYGKGVTIVAAAGNGGSNNGIDYPGAYPEVVAVAALDRTKARASYSDGGPQLDIAAPGSDVISTIGSGDTAYGTMSGTSMATPHVAGALALALSCAPTATRATLLDALYSTAEDLGAAGRDDLYGYGLARVDRLVANVCGSGGGTTNNPPTASFTATTSGLTASVDASASSDPDGDALTYSWAFGDGTTGTGRTASRTYAAAGTYTIDLTVSDGRGGSATTSRTVTVSTPSDPDPATPNLTSGQQISVALSGTGDEKFFKIAVPAGKSQLQVAMTGPACGVLGCSFDADLYTRLGSRPTDTTYACRPFQSGSTETCTHASPASGYWYVRVKAYTGGGTVNLKATIS